MTDIDKLQIRFRAIKLSGICFIGLTLLVWLLVRPLHAILGGLLIGELGGAGMVYSMMRQSHLHDNAQGTALMVSGVIGYVTRIVILVAVIVVAIKVPHVNVYAALAGYLLGFVFIMVGLYGYARNS